MATGDASPTITWGPLISATIMEYLESGMLRDQVHEKSELWKWMKSGNRIKTLSGGERIKVPLMYEGSGNFKRYSGLEALDVSGYDGITNAFFNWKQASTAVAISGLDKRSNQGENRIRDLTKDKLFQAQSTLADEMATDAFSDGTASGSKQISGLAAMVATTTTSGTYADVNTANNTAWRNQIQASIGSAATNLIPYLRTLYNDCTKIAGVDGEPDAIFTTQTVAEAAEALVLPAVRYVGGKDADMYSKPKFRNTSIMWDPKCTSGVLYMLNSRHVFLFVHQDANFSMMEAGMQQPINQDAYVAPILFQGNMGTNLRAALGKLTGIS